MDENMVAKPKPGTPEVVKVEKSKKLPIASPEDIQIL